MAGKFSRLKLAVAPVATVSPLLRTVCRFWCAVLLNRESSPVETYNDIDGDVVEFFCVLRNRHEELIQAITLTLFSREEYHRVIHGSTADISKVERAIRDKDQIKKAIKQLKLSPKELYDCSNFDILYRGNIISDIQFLTLTGKNEDENKYQYDKALLKEMLISNTCDANNDERFLIAPV